MDKLVFITGNKDKFAEASQIIPQLEQKDIDLPEIQEIDPEEIIKAKLNEARKNVQGNLIVEDVSFKMGSLKGLPGPLIKWFLKALGNDGLYEIAAKMDNTDVEVRLIIGLSQEQGDTVFFEGITKGTIVSPRGNGGWGFDAIVQPEGFDKTLGEMSPEEKNKISMRKIAFQKLKDYII